MTTVRDRLECARLCLLATTKLCRRPLIETVLRAIEGGVDVVQLREKELPDGPFLDLARTLGDAVREAGAIFILNDRAQAARVVPCDGVHLGQDDLPLDRARETLGEEMLIGISTHDRAQAVAAVEGGADYIGVGPVFPTTTKDTGYAPLGPAGAAKIAEGLSLPAFAIGGVTPENHPLLTAAGLTRCAVSSAILGAEDPRAAARLLRE